MSAVGQECRGQSLVVHLSKPVPWPSLLTMVMCEQVPGPRSRYLILIEMQVEGTHTGTTIRPAAAPRKPELRLQPCKSVWQEFAETRKPQLFQA